MSLAALADGSIADRKKPGRPRTRPLTSAERREATLQAAFNEIAESKPDKLRDIIARAVLFTRLARLRRDPALERSAPAIRERAERRLHALKRQTEQA
jgi:hypothetical protein